MSEHERARKAEREGEADSPLSREPDERLDPRTLGPRPEPEADAEPTEPPRRLKVKCTFFFFLRFYLFDRERERERERERWLWALYEFQALSIIWLLLTMLL